MKYFEYIWFPIPNIRRVTNSNTRGQCVFLCVFLFNSLVRLELHQICVWFSSRVQCVVKRVET